MQQAVHRPVRKVFAKGLNQTSTCKNWLILLFQKNWHNKIPVGATWLGGIAPTTFWPWGRSSPSPPWSRRLWHWNVFFCFVGPCVMGTENVGRQCNNLLLNFINDISFTSFVWKWPSVYWRCSFVLWANAHGTSTSQTDGRTDDLR